MNNLFLYVNYVLMKTTFASLNIVEKEDKTV